MIIFGVDFTSAPGTRKPITNARCRFKSGVLRVDHIQLIETFAAFEDFLKEDGPWVAGFDFPFGQPWALITDALFALPTDWSGYVGTIHGWGIRAWEERVTEFRDQQPVGFKERERIADGLARSRSPMKFYNPPVAKMFWQGAWRLHEAAVSIEPCRPLPDEQRVAVEAYPALVARRYAGSYKSDSLQKQTPERLEQRHIMLEALRSPLFQHEWGFSVDIACVDELVADASGDRLDAVLCAIQAAWSYTQRKRGYGVPGHRHPVIRSEGWIVDPLLTGSMH